MPKATCQKPAPPRKSLEIVADVLPEKDKHWAGNEQDRFKAIKLPCMFLLKQVDSDKKWRGASLT
jgi:hypothetical protein